MHDRAVTNEDEARDVICELGRRFYALGWVSGTGGGISLRVGERIVMAPSGVQKELLAPADLFVLDRAGNVVDGPAAERGLRVSECRPLFLHAFDARDAGAVIHSHALPALLATLIVDEAVVVTELEMMKGLAGVGFHDVHAIPVIENTAHERDLTERLAGAMDAHPRAHAVLVRRHGIYVWGRDWREAKRHAECYHYLLEATVEMRRLGLDASVPAGGPRRGSPS